MPPVPIGRDAACVHSRVQRSDGVFGRMANLQYFTPFLSKLGTSFSSSDKNGIDNYVDVHVRQMTMFKKTVLVELVGCL